MVQAAGQYHAAAAHRGVDAHQRLAVGKAVLRQLAPVGLQLGRKAGREWAGAGQGENQHGSPFIQCPRSRERRRDDVMAAQRHLDPRLRLESFRLADGAIPVHVQHRLLVGIDAEPAAD
jgi:hypothetical protein